MLKRMFLLIAITCGVTSFALRAQSTPDTEAGLDPYASYHGGAVDVVNMGTGSLTVNIPIILFPQRGKLNLAYSLFYNSNHWHPVAVPAAANPTYIWTDDSHIYDGDCHAVGMNLISSVDWCPANTQEYQVGASSNPGCVGDACGEQGPGLGGSNPPVQLWYVTSVVDPTGGTHEFAPALSSGKLISVDAQGLQFNSTSGIIQRDGTTVGYGGGPIAPINTGLTVATDIYGNTIGNSLDSTGRALPSVESVGTQGCPSGATSALSWTVPAYTTTAYSPQGQATYTFCLSTIQTVSDFNFNRPVGSTPIFLNTSTNPTIVGGGNQTVMTAVILPDNREWQFLYDTHGNLQKLTFPTGGSISYTWVGAQTCQTGELPTYVYQVTTRTVDPGDGTPTSTWSYTYGGGPEGGSATVTDPENNVTVHGTLACGAETLVASYQGSQATGTLLKTVATEYSTATQNPADQNASLMNLIPTKVTTTLASGAQSVKTMTPDSGILVSDVTIPIGNPPNSYPVVIGSIESTAEYDFGVYQAGGAPLRTTTTKWMWEQDVRYFNAGLLDLPASKSVTDSTHPLSNPASQTIYQYDEAQYSPNSASSANGVLGNLTTTTVWNDSGTSPQSHTGWYPTGEKAYTVDADLHINANGHTNDYQYNQCGGSAVTDSWNALNQHTKAQYDCQSGLVTSITDTNANTTSYGYDVFDRITSVTYPPTTHGSGQVFFAYDDPHLKVTKTVTATPNPTQMTVVSFDGLGRQKTKQTTTGAGTIEIDTTYDLNGRVHTVTNPYYVGLPTDLTVHKYDALGREVITQNPDGSTSQVCYEGIVSVPGQSTCSALATPALRTRALTWQNMADESGVERQLASDGLNRLVAAVEMGNATSPLALETDYAYDSLNSLRSVRQLGASGETSRSRSFAYDSLSRLITSQNPETGTICYGLWTGNSCSGGYDPNGNMIHKTDARGVTVNYNYDALNRLVSKTYSDTTTPSSCYLYDVPIGSQAGTNTIGRLVSSWTQLGNCPLATQTSIPSSAINWKLITNYDAMGRVLSEQQCPFSPCSPNSMGYSYDVAGNLTSSTNGLPPNSAPGMTLTYLSDAAARLQSVVSSWSDANHPPTLFRADEPTATSLGQPFPYSAFGALSAALYGVDSSSIAAQLSDVRSYDNRLRLSSKTVLGSGISAPIVNSTTTTLSINPSAFTVEDNPDVEINVSCNTACGTASLSFDGTPWIPAYPLDGNGDLGGSGYTISSWPVPNSTPGPHVITAYYQGNGIYLPSSTSTTITLNPIGPVQTTVSLSAVSPSTFTTVENAVMTAKVSCANACGSVQFLIDGNVWYEGNVDITGTIVVDTYWWGGQSFAQGVHTLTAKYLGNSKYSPATSQSTTFTVAPVGTATLPITITLVPGTTFSASNEFTVWVHANCNGACNGFMYLLVDGNIWVGGSLDPGGYFVVDSGWAGNGLFSPGPHNVQAYFLGNATYAPTAPSVTVTSTP